MLPQDIERRLQSSIDLNSQCIMDMEQVEDKVDLETYIINATPISCTLMQTRRQILSRCPP